MDSNEKKAKGGSRSLLPSTDRRTVKARRSTARLIAERVRYLVDEAPHYALFMLDQKGVVLSWNAGAERLKGYRAEEAIGKNFAIFYSPEDRELGHPQEELRAAATEGRYEEEGWRVRKDGSRFFANILITAIRDDAGHLQGYAKVTRDVTQVRKLHVAIQRQARILDLANDTIFVRDSTDRITYWNRGAERVYGWSAAEAVGRITHDLLQTRFSTPLEEIMSEIRKIKHWEGELEHITRDGVTIYVASRWTLDSNEDGSYADIIEMNHDITTRKQIEAALVAKNHELEQALLTKDRFLAMMSHELRTPLNGIIGFSELLFDGIPGAINDKQREFLGDVLDSADHLLNLINDVLDLAKIEAGRMDLHVGEFPLMDAVEQACAGVRPTAEKKGIELSMDASGAVGQVCLDERRVRQILYNLLSNAVKFTDAGGRVTVEVTQEVQGRIVLRVHDTGIGISKENLPRLFRTFEQLDDSAQRRFEGTGLGLALTRRLVELQGGEIDVHSVVGRGSTFTVMLPTRVDGRSEAVSTSTYG